MIRGWSLRLRCGSAARTQRIAAKSFTSRSARHRPSSTSSNVPGCALPALFTRMSSPPSSRAAASTKAATAGPSVTSSARAKTRAPAPAKLGRRGLERAVAPRAQRQVGALGGQLDRDGPADPLAATGDQRATALQPEVHAGGYSRRPISCISEYRTTGASPSAARLCRLPRGTYTRSPGPDLPALVVDLRHGAAALDDVDLVLGVVHVRLGPGDGQEIHAQRAAEIRRQQRTEVAAFRRLRPHVIGVDDVHAPSAWTPAGRAARASPRAGTPTREAAGRRASCPARSSCDT